MQMPSGSFNSQMTPGDIQKASFVTRLYGLNNQRGPFKYPRSPYALGMGDIAPMAAMQPIDQDVLFTTLPTTSTLATSTAPLGSAGFPTFQASAPGSAGTILGPAGSTVPELPFPTLAANSVPGSGSPSGSDPLSYTSPYGTAGAPTGSNAWSPDGSPAPTLNIAARTGRPAGPVTFQNPWPSIISPPPQPQGAAAPSALCQFGAWINQNPGLAILGTVGIYFLCKGGKKR